MSQESFSLLKNSAPSADLGVDNNTAVIPYDPNNSPRLTMGGIYGTNVITLPIYPFYSVKQQREYCGRPDYYNPDSKYHSPLILALAARRNTGMYAVGDPGLMPRDSRMSWIDQYFADFLGISKENFEGIEGYSDGNNYPTRGYSDKLKELLKRYPNSRVATLHPIIDEEELVLRNFYMDPQLASRINNKQHTGEYTSQAPRRKVVLASALKNPENYKEFSFPFWVKTDASSGGEGVVRVENEADVEKIVNRFEEKNIIVEEDFPHDENYNVQVVIHKKDGQISFVGHSQQRIENGAHIGNIINTDNRWEDLPEAIRKLVEEASRKIQLCGASGLLGLDVLYDKSSKQARCPDINFRINGSTAFQTLRGHIQNSFGATVLRCGGFYPKNSNMTPKEIERLIREKTEAGILFLNGAVMATTDMPASDRRKKYAFFGAVLGNNMEDISKNTNDLRKDFVI